MLDIGAKRAGLATVAREQGLELAYTGADLSAANVELARADGFDVVQANVDEPLPFPNASFDCVFALELLEHLVTPLHLLEEMRRVLVDDGRAVISVPSPYSWVEVARELFGLHDTEGHLTAFTTPVLTNVAALAGFRVARRLGTSLRLPKLNRPFATNSILARSRIYVLRPADTVIFAGRELG